MDALDELSPADWVDIMATWLDGAVSTWIERELQRARR